MYVHGLLTTPFKYLCAPLFSVLLDSISVGIQRMKGGAIAKSITKNVASVISSVRVDDYLSTGSGASSISDWEISSYTRLLPIKKAFWNGLICQLGHSLGHKRLASQRYIIASTISSYIDFFPQMSTPSKLFQPISVGSLTLQHHIVMAPLTRFRARKFTHVPAMPLVKEYYSQRSRTPGTLLITEATLIAPKAGGYPNVPGIWSAEQISAWKEIVDAVHANGSFIFLQLWTVGRAAYPDGAAAESITVVAPSPIPLSYQPEPIPKELTVEEIHEYVELYAQAAKNAVHLAGFDGVEVHAGNGYLLDQFLQDTSNKRTDKYGGSIENRSRFVLEALNAVTRSVGEEKSGIRLSPWSTFQDMRMEDPVPQFTHLVSALKAAHPSLAYLHVIEPRVAGDNDAENANLKVVESNHFIRAIWEPKPLIAAGGFNRATAITRTEETGNLIAFGRQYIANPDLPLRLAKDIPLNKHDRTTFYVSGDSEEAAVGYTDYTFA